MFLDFVLVFLPHYIWIPHLRCVLLWQAETFRKYTHVCVCFQTVDSQADLSWKAAQHKPLSLFLGDLVICPRPDFCVFPGLYLSRLRSLESLFKPHLCCCGGRLVFLLLNEGEIAQQKEYVVCCRMLHIRQCREIKEPLGRILAYVEVNKLLSGDISNYSIYIMLELY